MQGEYIIMNKNVFTSPYRLSWAVMIYGFYAAICHATAIYLFALYNNEGLLTKALTNRYAPMLEHTLMTVALVTGGAALILYICKKFNGDTHTK